jgi:hypothetical protein
MNTKSKIISLLLLTAVSFSAPSFANSDNYVDVMADPSIQVDGVPLQAIVSTYFPGSAIKVGMSDGTSASRLKDYAPNVVGLKPDGSLEFMVFSHTDYSASELITVNGSLSNFSYQLGCKTASYADWRAYAKELASAGAEVFTVLNPISYGHPVSDFRLRDRADAGRSTICHVPAALLSQMVADLKK